MPITVANPFKGRQYPGDVILQAVPWICDIRWPMNMLPSYWQSGAWKWMPVVFGVGCKSTRRN
jgi:hypothetical protein